MTLDPALPNLAEAPLGCCDPVLGAKLVRSLRNAARDPELIVHRAHCLACEVRFREFLAFDRTVRESPRSR